MPYPFVFAKLVRPSFPAATTTVIPAAHAFSTSWQSGSIFVAFKDRTPQRKIDDLDVVDQAQLNRAINRQNDLCVVRLTVAIQNFEVEQVNAWRDTVDVVKIVRSIRIRPVPADDSRDMRAMPVVIVHTFAGYKTFRIHHIGEKVRQTYSDFVPFPIRSALTWIPLVDHRHTDPPAQLYVG